MLDGLPDSNGLGGLSKPGGLERFFDRFATAKSSPLTACFFAISLLLSVAFVATRNTYDDEYSNLTYVSLSVPQIIHAANSADVHPPGMYLLTHFAFEATPSPRWMTLWDVLLLYAGLATYLFAVAPLFTGTGSRMCFLLLAALHPQLLMWGNTIRWYGWWTGVALITLVVAMRPGAEARRDPGSRHNPGPLANTNVQALPRFSYPRAVVLGLLLVCLFYLNYITLVFGAALGLTMLFRYSWRAWKQFLLTLAVFTPLIVPQLHAFLTVHIPGGSGQRAGIALSLARLVDATLCSEAYLPWHPLAILALVVFPALLVYGAIRAYRLARASTLSAALLTGEPGLASLVLFSLLFFCLVVAAGFGVKPRNGLLLIPLLAVPFALIVGSLRSGRLQALVLGFIALWSGVGIGHLLGREGLTKSNMNNRPEELTRYLQQAQGADCSVVVTYDSLMALTVSTSHLPRTLLLTPAPSPIPLHEPPFVLDQCARVDLYRVQSYLGGLGPWGKGVSDQMAAALPSPPAKILNLSPDPQAARKRRLTFLTGASDLPDYRYVVRVNALTPTEFVAVEQKLRAYKPVDGQPRPGLPGGL
jgi:hypothetical protein